MYSRKSVGPRIDPWGTPALTGYSCEDFPSKTTRSRLLLKRRNKTKYLTWKSIRLRFVKKTSIPHSAMSKALDIWSATARVAADLLKALAILSDTTVRRSAIDREDLKPYWKSEKRAHFPGWSTILLFTSFSKTFLTKERRLTGR